MEAPALQLEKDGPIALLTWNRPRLRNRFDAATAVQLAQAWDSIRDNSSLRAVVLTGSHGMFCTGPSADELHRDVTAPHFRPTDSWEERCWKDPDLIYRASLRDMALPKPLLIAVEGPCFGAGLEILNAADIAVAGQRAEFGLALEFETVDTDTAQEMGLIQHVVTQGEAFATAWKMSREVSIHDPMAIALSRRVFSRAAYSSSKGVARSLGIGLG